MKIVGLRGLLLTVGLMGGAAVAQDPSYGPHELPPPGVVTPGPAHGHGAGMPAGPDSGYWGNGGAAGSMVGYGDASCGGAGDFGGAGFGYPSGGAGLGYPGGGGFGVGGWSAGAGGLIMTRDNENHYLFSYDTADESVQLLNTRDANMEWAGGFETWLRYVGCGGLGIEAVYWGLYPGNSSSTVTADHAVGNLNGIQNWISLDYNGLSGDQYVDDAQAHRVLRDHDFQNVEVNILSFPGAGSACGSACWNWLLGVRYFRFNELLQFGSDPTDRYFDGDPDELYYDITTDNNLVGFQLGGSGRYCVTQRLALTSGLKFGLFNNHINSTSAIYGTNGVATINNGPFTGVPFFSEQEKDDVAFLGEINAGLSYQVGCRWAFYGGYRAVAITGVALPTNQIYPDLRGINDLESIESNGSLILHGAYMGGQFCF